MQSFSMYMPYADTTMFSVDVDAQLFDTISAHWACTALYNCSPVRLAMFAPDVKSVVAQIAFISPAMSNVPWVDSDLDFALAKMSLIPLSCFAELDVSLDVAAAFSPSDAVSIALTSAPVFGITSIFKSLKSCNWSDVWDNARSRDCISVRRDEQTHLRYVSFCFAQN